MSKYKTIEGKVNRQTLQQAIQNRLLTNRIAKMTLDSPEMEKALMSTNKSIIYIKLPKKSQKNINFFRSSLYQSSLKRLKQQKVTIIKQDRIPSITSKKTFQAFQEEVLRKAIKQRNAEKKEYLPQVYYYGSNSEQQRNGNFSQRRLQQRIQEEDQDEQNGEFIPKRKHQRTSTFEVDGSILGYRNLKQKYLELKQLSLNNKRKSELLEKHENKRYALEQQFYQFDSKFKMQNRYMKKDLFQTKVNGLRTIIYPSQKSQLHSKKDIEFTQRRKEYPSYEKQDKNEVSNFFKRKKLRSYALNLSNEFSQQQHQNEKFGSNGKQNPEQREKGNDCTPWQTDFVNFD